jgi:hypothetical protein
MITEKIDMYLTEAFLEKKSNIKLSKKEKELIKKYYSGPPDYSEGHLFIPRKELETNKNLKNAINKLLKKKLLHPEHDLPGSPKVVYRVPEFKFFKVLKKILE